MLIKYIIIFFLITKINCNNTKEQRIIIIGAGGSGIAAASKLFENNFKNVKILEAENRIGGRINTINFGENVVDLGAQWCHGEVNNVVFELANQFNLLEPSGISEDVIKFIKTDGTVLDNQTSIEQMLYLFTITSSEAIKSYEGTIGTFIKTEYNKITQSNGISLISEDVKNEFLRFFENYICGLSATSDWDKESGRGYSSYKICDGNLLLAWKSNGYKTILDILMNKYSETSKPYPVEENIIFNSKVNKIIWDGEEIIVKTENNNTYSADKLIITASLGVLKANYKSLFSPSLPEQHALAIDSLAFGVVNKIYIEYEQPWWPPVFAGFSLLWKKEDIANLEKDEQWLLGVVGIYPVDHQPKLLNIWIVGKYVKQFELLTDEQYKAGIKKLFKSIFNVVVANIKPANMIRTTWSLNENFYGSYSYRGLEADKNNITGSDIAVPLKNNLGEDSVYFAGEATHEKYFSTVHGAIETGFRAAQQIINQCN